MAVMHKNDSIQLIRDTEGVDNKDRVRILSPGTSPPAVETDVTRQVLYMDLKNTPDDGEPYEYEFTCCTGRKFIPQRSGDANKFEGRTSQEVKRLFADGRSIPAGTGETVTVDANGDRIENVTVYGFTEQAGTGDASPNNVREISVGGKKLVEVDSSQLSWIRNGGLSDANANVSFFYVLNNSIPVAPKTASNVFSQFIATDVINSSVTTELIYVTDVLYVSIKKKNLKSDTVAGLVEYLKNNGRIIWYEPADETQATGIYTPVEINGSECHCACVPLTAHLCDGDTVETCVKSGCDKSITFDGSSDENWNIYSNTSSVSSFYVSISDKIVKEGSSLCDLAANVANPFGFAATSYPKNLVFCDHNSLARLYFTPQSKMTTDEWKQYLSGNPITVWYRSTEYTEENDMPVCLEIHNNWLEVFDGKEAWYKDSTYGNFFAKATNPKELTNAENYACSHYKPVNRAVSHGTDKTITASSVNILIYDSAFNDAEELKAYLRNQFESGTPVKFERPLSSQIIYAHDPVHLEAYPDGNGKFTVSGEKIVSVEQKALQDGGNASKLGGKLPEDYAAVENALGVYTHTKSGTVHSLTGKGDNIRFVATADFAAGDTMQVNGVTCTASTMSGDALWAGFFKSGAVVVCYKNGNSLNFNGGGLAASEVAKITPENLKTGVSVTVNGKKVDGTFTADATATAGSMLSGKTAYVNGEKVTGAIQSKGAATHTPGTADKLIAAGVYLSGTQTIKGSPFLLPENIKSGKTIFDVEGTFTADATATAGDMLSGKTAYVNGEKVTGTIPVYAEKGPSSVFVYNNNLHFANIPEGYYTNSWANTPGIVAALSTVASAIGLTSDKLLAGNTVCGVAGGIPNKAAIEAAVSVVLSGGSLYVRIPRGAYLTNASSGYPEASVSQGSIANAIGLTSSVIKSGVSICGISGSVQSVIPVATVSYGNVLAKEAAGSSYLQTGMSSGWANSGYGALQNIGFHGYGQLTGMYVEWKCNVSGNYTITKYGDGTITHSGAVWLNSGTVVRLTFAEPTDIYWRDRKSGGFMVAYNA